MKAFRRVWNRLAGSLAGGRREAELADEFESHIHMLTEENLRRGLSPAEARRAALLAFGGVEAAKESYRDQRGLPALASIRQDAAYALRGMRRNPVFTGVAVACLALGIGANTAIFSLVNAVVLRPLPVHHPEQLVFFGYSPVQGDMSPVRRLTTGAGSSVPWVTYEALRDSAQTLEGVFVFVSAGSESNGLTVQVDGRPFAADGEMVTGKYFTLLGVAPVLGRTIVDSDLAAEAPAVVVISHKFWQREFAGQRSAAGRSITVNGSPFTIVGVAPPEFRGLQGAVPDFWFPLRPTAAVKPWGSRAATGDAIFGDRRWWWCTVGGRLKAGVTRSRMLAETAYLFRQSITAGVTRVPPVLPALTASSVSPVFQTMRRRFSPSLRMLALTAALVLLIACANVATLMVARAKARQKEIGVRLAIGASRARVIRQLLTESVLLSGCGGLLGLLFAQWAALVLLQLIAGSRQITPLNVSPDGAVLAFAVVVSLGTGILFGLAPAFRATRTSLSSQLTGAAASTTPRRTLAKVLVASQVALSVVLLFVAGLLVRSFRMLDSQPLGFDRENLWLFEIDPERSGYSGARGMALHNQLAERLGKLPGVRSVTYSQEALLAGSHNSTPTATDGAPLPPGQPNEDYYNRVGAGFFETMGIRIVLGREIGLRDTDGSRPTAVVNESWARAHFPAGNPLGHLITPGGDRFDPQKAYLIVGVAADAKYDLIRALPPRTVYIAYGATWDRSRRMCFAVRTTGAPASIAASVQQAVRGVDPNLPLFNIRTQSQQIQEAMGQERMLAHISIFFGGLALLLVAIGVYGTLSYAVTQRTGEIGIRIALGARRAEVQWMILRESLTVAGFGLAAGLPVALTLSRLAKSILFGVGASDGMTMAATVVLLVAIAAAAGYLPANRASRIDPIRALRHE